MGRSMRSDKVSSTGAGSLERGTSELVEAAEDLGRKVSDFQHHLKGRPAKDAMYDLVKKTVVMIQKLVDLILADTAGSAPGSQHAHVRCLLKALVSMESLMGIIPGDSGRHWRQRTIGPAISALASVVSVVNLPDARLKGSVHRVSDFHAPLVRCLAKYRSLDAGIVPPKRAHSRFTKALIDCRDVGVLKGVLETVISMCKAAPAAKDQLPACLVESEEFLRLMNDDEGDRRSSKRQSQDDSGVAAFVQPCDGTTMHVLLDTVVRGAIPPGHIVAIDAEKFVHDEPVATSQSCPATAYFGASNLVVVRKHAESARLLASDAWPAFQTYEYRAFYKMSCRKSEKSLTITVRDSNVDGGVRQVTFHGSSNTVLMELQRSAKAGMLRAKSWRASRDDAQASSQFRSRRGGDLQRKEKQKSDASFASQGQRKRANLPSKDGCTTFEAAAIDDDDDKTATISNDDGHVAATRDDPHSHARCTTPSTHDSSDDDPMRSSSDVVMVPRGTSSRRRDETLASGGSCKIVVGGEAVDAASSSSLTLLAHGGKSRTTVRTATFPERGASTARMGEKKKASSRAAEPAICKVIKKKNDRIVRTSRRNDASSDKNIDVSSAPTDATTPMDEEYWPATAGGDHQQYTGRRQLSQASAPEETSSLSLNGSAWDSSESSEQQRPSMRAGPRHLQSSSHDRRHVSHEDETDHEEAKVVNRRKKRPSPIRGDASGFVTVSSSSQTSLELDEPDGLQSCSDQESTNQHRKKHSIRQAGRPKKRRNNSTPDDRVVGRQPEEENGMDYAPSHFFDSEQSHKLRIDRDHHYDDCEDDDTKSDVVRDSSNSDHSTTSDGIAGDQQEQHFSTESWPASRLTKKRPKRKTVRATEPEMDEKTRRIRPKRVRRTVEKRNKTSDGGDWTRGPRGGGGQEHNNNDYDSQKIDSDIDNNGDGSQQQQEATLLRSNDIEAGVWPSMKGLPSVSSVSTDSSDAAGLLLGDILPPAAADQIVMVQRDEALSSSRRHRASHRTTSQRNNVDGDDNKMITTDLQRFQTEDATLMELLKAKQMRADKLVAKVGEKVARTFKHANKLRAKQLDDVKELATELAPRYVQVDEAARRFVSTLKDLQVDPKKRANGAAQPASFGGDDIAANVRKSVLEELARIEKDAHVTARTCTNQAAKLAQLVAKNVKRLDARGVKLPPQRVGNS